MSLEQIAQQAMDYLDSVGVEADYEMFASNVFITTDKYEFRIFITEYYDPLTPIKDVYPQKSPAK